MSEEQAQIQRLRCVVSTNQLQWFTRYEVGVCLNRIAELEEEKTALFEDRSRHHKRIAELEAALENDVNAAAWILEWMVADKYRKPDVPAIIAKARVDVRKREARTAELEAAINDLLEMVDGATGVIRHGIWRDENGTRLKDIPEYVSLYNLARKPLEEGK